MIETNKEYNELYYKSGNYLDYLSREEKYKSLALELKPLLLDLNINNILDFGCGVGFLVKHINEMGFNCLGYETSFWALNYGKKFITEDIFNDVDFLKKEYDCFLFFDSLEHNYVSFIENILYSIKSQYLFIRIPVSEYGSNNFFLDVSRRDPTHVTCMSKQSWLQLFKRFQFEEIYRFKGKYIWDSPGVLCAILQKIF
jgi:SAM-dependent methyltransferase